MESIEGAGARAFDSGGRRLKFVFGGHGGIEIFGARLPRSDSKVVESGSTPATTQIKYSSSSRPVNILCEPYPVFELWLRALLDQ